MSNLSMPHKQRKIRRFLAIAKVILGLALLALKIIKQWLDLMR